MIPQIPKRVIATVEARMASTRLPGKVLLKALSVPMIHRQVHRLREVESVDDVIVATTTSKSDDVLCRALEGAGVRYFRGSEADVVGRVLAAAEHYEGQVIVQTTGDCPVIDPKIVAKAVETFFDNADCIVTNGWVRSFPDGMDVAVLDVEMLKRIDMIATKPIEREHTLLAAKSRKSEFKYLDLVAEAELNWPQLGLTLDTAEDYILLSRLIEELEPLNPFFGCGEAISFLRRNPRVANVNSHIVRKGDY